MARGPWPVTFELSTATRGSACITDLKDKKKAAQWRPMLGLTSAVNAYDMRRLKLISTNKRDTLDTRRFGWVRYI